MEDKDLQGKLKEIEHLVSTLSEPVKSITAQEMIRKLFADDKRPSSNSSSPKVAYARKARGGADGRKMDAVKTDEKKDALMISNINRTEYPEIHQLDNNLDRALFILKLMKDKGYDGLNPSQINQILTTVFRVKSNKPVVSMALIRDKHYTEKKPEMYKGTKANTFRIMHKGEQYVDDILTRIRSNIHERNPGNAQQTSGEESEK
ncbi:hypothetical protein KW787_03840 [Candidatus Pacearchaeota archaeon]|nr:hypothetical protein [Candidatus Pacearchaeota archaeon]